MSQDVGRLADAWADRLWGERYDTTDAYCDRCELLQGDCENGIEGACIRCEWCGGRDGECPEDCGTGHDKRCQEHYWITKKCQCRFDPSDILYRDAREDQ